MLSPEESHHLFHVLRQHRELPLHLTDGQGHLYIGVLVGKHGRRARVEISRTWQDTAETRTPRLILVCAVVKGRRFEWVLEKAVELGAHEIRPLQAERGIVIAGAGRQERWQMLLVAALKQAGRSFLPPLSRVSDLYTCLGDLPGDMVFFGDCSDADETVAVPAPLPAASLLADTREPDERLVWVVGPEGGWTATERQVLTAAGARPVSLGPHRLRTETAAVVGLGLLQVLRQRWLA